MRLRTFVLLSGFCLRALAQPPQENAGGQSNLAVVNEPISANDRARIVSELRLVSSWLLTYSEQRTDRFERGYLLGQSDFAAGCADVIATRRSPAFGMQATEIGMPPLRTQSPIAYISVTPMSAAPSDTVTVAFTLDDDDNDMATYSVRHEGHAQLANNAQVGDPAEFDGAFRYRIPLSAKPGQHTFAVEVIDRAGHTGSDSVLLLVTERQRLSACPAP
jgi:hypothetical protein